MAWAAPCAAALLLLLLACSRAEAAALVEHSLDAGQSFSRAGQIVLQENDAVSGVFERQGLSSTQLSQLQQLVESDSLYLWRVTLPDQAPVLTSIKASCLAPALTAPQYALHLDAAGHIMSAQIRVPASATPGGSCSTSHALQALKGLSASDLSDLKDIDVAVHTPKPGPAVPKPAEAAAAPDLAAGTGAAQQPAQQKQQQRQQPQQRQAAGQGAAGKAGEQAAEGEGGEAAAAPVDERTWLQKNWVIVAAGVTMVLNVLLRGVVDPAQAQQGAQARPAQGRRAIQQ